MRIITEILKDTYQIITGVIEHLRQELSGLKPLFMVLAVFGMILFIPYGGAIFGAISLVVASVLLMRFLAITLSRYIKRKSQENVY
jgi:hypothetical protein